VCVLIIQAILRLWKTSVVDAFTLVLYAVILSLSALSTFTGLLPVKIPAAVLVILSGVAGLTASLVKDKNSSGKKEDGK
jgi:chromate transporter